MNLVIASVYDLKPLTETIAKNLMLQKQKREEREAILQSVDESLQF